MIVFIKKLIPVIACVALFLPPALCQQNVDLQSFRETPRLSVKSNLLYNLTTTISVGTEFRLAHKVTFDAPFHINPWTFNAEENRKFKFLLVQPGFRFWFCEAFNGHFFGLHGHYAYYNVSALPDPPFSGNMSRHRYEGQLFGAGASYGFQWIIGKRWGLEFEIGGGYARMEHDKFPCQTCAPVLVEKKVRDYLGITRIGFSLIYHIF